MARQLGMPAPTKLLNDVEKMLAQHAQVKHVPLVLWAGLEEGAEAFAVRCAGFQNLGVDRILAAVRFGFPVPSGVQGVPFAPKLFVLLHPSTPSRYRTGDGGRGSGKSHGFATALVLRALSQRMRILCAREFMRSLRESVHHLIQAKIEALGLLQYFEITDRAITCVTSKSEFIFAGLFQNSSALKSLEEIKIVWCEQAETVTQDSLEILIPTIRDPGSEIWFSLNPDDPLAPVQSYADGLRPDTLRAHVIFSDNPWWPKTLEGERLYLQRVDADAYAHIYLGACRMQSEAQVFKGKYSIEPFDTAAMPKPESKRDPVKDRLASLGRNEDIERILRHERKTQLAGPYYGADWGFSVDPTVLIKCWILDRILYIEYEAYGVGVDTDKIPALFDQVPGAREHAIRADSARPETISALRQNGYPKIVGVDKWKGSVEDGVAHMRSYEKVVIHPRCIHTAEEFRLYSFKVDKLSGDVLTDLVDRHNHTIDGIRYALAPVIKSRGRARVTELRI